jgi:hypothetical protein
MPRRPDDPALLQTQSCAAWRVWTVRTEALALRWTICLASFRSRWRNWAKPPRSVISMALGRYTLRDGSMGRRSTQHTVRDQFQLQRPEGRLWAMRVRRRGDLSEADIRLWSTDLVLSLACIAGAAVTSYSIAQVSSWREDYVIEFGLALATNALAIAWIVASLIEMIVSRSWLRGSPSRRRIMLQVDSPAARRIRTLKVVLAIPSLGLAPSPLTGRGFVNLPWIVALSVLWILVLITLAEKLQLGDFAILVGSTFLILGDFVPLYAYRGFANSYTTEHAGAAVAAVARFRPRHTSFTMLVSGH